MPRDYADTFEDFVNRLPINGTVVPSFNANATTSDSHGNNQALVSGK